MKTKIMSTTNRVKADLAQMAEQHGKSINEVGIPELLNRYEIDSEELKEFCNSIATLVVTHAIDAIVEGISKGEDDLNTAMNGLKTSVLAGIWEAYVIGHEVGRNT